MNGTGLVWFGQQAAAMVTRRTEKIGGQMDGERDHTHTHTQAAYVVGSE